MGTANKRISELSSAKRRLLELRMKQKGISLSEEHAVTAVSKRAYYPASFSQKSLYALQSLDEEATAYNNPYVYRLIGEINYDRLEVALQELIERHEVLRTCFDVVDGEVVQKVFEVSDLSFEHLQCSKDQFLDLIEGFVKPFELREGPLFRVALFEDVKAESVLCFDIHHAIMDGESMRVLVRDFASFYSGLNPDPLTLQYRDYAVWEQEAEGAVRLEAQKPYWVNQFEGELPRAILPTSFARPQVQRFVGSSYEFYLEEPVASKIRDFCIQYDVTLYMFLLAVYKVLLAKYSDSEDIIVGSAVSNRVQGEVKELIGMFVNTLVFRSFPESNKTFVNYLNELKELCLQNFQNQSYPFPRLIEDLGIQSEAGRNPLFDCMFVLQNMEQAKFEVDGLLIEELPFSNKVSRFDLCLICSEERERILCRFEYRTDLFSRNQIGQISQHFETLLRNVLEEEAVKVRDLKIIPPKENDAGRGYMDSRKSVKVGETIVSVFEQRVKEQPDAIACVFEDGSLTYEGLNRRANFLASHLLQHYEVGPEVVVGLCMPRSLEMMVGVWAILKAGGVYLPIANDCPVEQKKFILKNSEAKVLLVGNAASAFGAERLPVVDLSTFDFSSSCCGNLDVKLEPENAFIVLYTSGTTGRPKGVVLNHNNLLNVLSSTAEKYPMGEGCVMLQKTPCTFDASAWEMFLPVFIGCSQVLLKTGDEKSPQHIREAMLDHRVSVAFFVPSMLSAYLDALSGRGGLGGLDWCVCGGEPLTSELSRRYFEEAGGGTNLVNIYGPTETTIYTVAHCVKKSELEIPIGQPVLNTRLFVVGSDMELRPSGVEGQLQLGGIQLARGYLNNPMLTAEKFRPSVCGDGERIYLTGDIVKQGEEGDLYFVGRRDFQVKIRGNRIEFGEIEENVKSFDGISECLVVVRHDVGLEKTLCVYFVSEKEVKLQDLRNHLMENVPSYMIPQFWVRMDVLPRTVSGKLNRKALPRPEGAMDAEQHYVLPKTALESGLAAIWAEVLSVARVGVRDGFFELGGHSLKAVRICSLIGQRLSKQCHVRDIFECLTVERLARRITEQDDLECSISAVSNQEHYRLSHSQKRLWLLCQSSEVRRSYNITLTVKIDEKVDVYHLESAINQTIQRHEILRTSFILVDEEPRQRIKEGANFQFDCHDLRGSPTLNDDVDFYIKREERHLFNFEEAPLLRGTILGFDECSNVVIFTIHHIVFDGWSMDLFIDEVLERLNTLVHGGGRNFDRLDIQYKDFAEWEFGYLSSPSAEGSKKYWVDKLSGELPSIDCFIDKQRPFMRSHDGSSLTLELSGVVSDSIHELSRELDVTLFTVLSSVASVLMYIHTRNNDVVFGSPYMGRGHADLDKQIGFYVNTIVLRNRLNTDSTFKDIVRSTKRNLLEAYEHGQVPFDQILDALNLKYDMSRNPVFDVFISMVSSVVENRSKIDGYAMPISTVKSRNSISKFDLSIDFSDLGDTINCLFTYQLSIFEEDTVRRMMVQFQELSSKLVEEQDVPVGELIDCYLSDNSLLEKTRGGELMAGVLDDGLTAKVLEENVKDYVYEALENIWSDILSIDNIQSSDNFFILGGNSIQAFEMMIGIKKKLDVAVSTDLIFNSHDLRDLAGEVRSIIGVPDGNPGLEKVGSSNAGGQEQHLFRFSKEVSSCASVIVPGSMGIVSPYFALAKNMEELGCVVGTQMQGVFDGESPLRSIEEIADYNIQLLLEQGVTDVPILAGHSFGALVAFEMASKLEGRKDINVSKLVLMDCASEMLNGSRSDAGEGEASSYFEEYISSSLEESNAKALGDGTGGFDLEAFSGRLLELNNVNVSMTYQPPVLTDTNIYVVRAGEASCLGWSQYGKVAEELVAAGDHFTMIEDASSSVWLGKLLRA